MKNLNLEIKHRRDRLNKKLSDGFKREVYNSVGILDNAFLAYVIKNAWKIIIIKF
jgi:hypothetical protein